MSEPIRLLIIDDSEDDRLLYRRSLRHAQLSYDIDEAEDGADGLSRLNGRVFDCILLDYSLPGHNGIEILKQIRTRAMFVPIVMLTGQGSESIAVNAMQGGAQDYITKSAISPETLERVIQLAIEHCELQRRVTEQHESLEIFTRALAHDMKEPVQAMRSYLSLLATEPQLSAEGKRHLDQVRTAADRLHRLIEIVFFYTRTDIEPAALRGPANSDTVLDQVLQSLSELITARGAQVTRATLPPLPLQEQQLALVLHALLENALLHGGPAPRIDVSAWQEGAQWRIAITDSGPGIPADLIDQLFLPFRRLAVSTTEDHIGFGLGLAVAKRILEGCDGQICYEDVPGGGGARFIITLPCWTEDLSTVTDSTTAATTALIQHATEPANVLLIEDNPADIELTKILLMEKNRLHFNLYVATNGYDGLDRLQQDPPIDLVLLDINMPGLDGFRVLEAIKADARLCQIPVSMCTTSNYDRDMERARELGATGFITKPPTLDQLKNVLAAVPNLLLRSDGPDLHLETGARRGSAIGCD